MRFYLDGSPVRTLYRFYRQIGAIRVYAGCSPLSGLHHTSQGYPYKDKSESRLIFTTTMHGDNKGTYTPSRAFHHQMEIDYVKVWQRHPEYDGFAEICNSNLAIQGPSSVCGPTTYTISNPQSSGTWSVSTGAVNIVSSSYSSVTLAQSTTDPNVAAVLTYSYPSSTCTAPVTVTKSVTTDTYMPSVSVTRNTYFTNSIPKQRFTLWTTPLPGRTYQWNVTYSIPTSGGPFPIYTTGSFSATGSAIISPLLSYYNQANYTLNYALTVTTACGSKTYNGVKTNNSYYRERPVTSVMEDFTMHSAETAFAGQDSADMDAAVLAEMEAYVFPETVTEADIEEKHAQIWVEHLAPYLVEEDMPADYTGEGGRPALLPDADSAATAAPSAAATRVYPNPAAESITVHAASRFDRAAPLEITIHDATGRLWHTATVPAGWGQPQIPLAGLRAATYFVVVRQGGDQDYTRFVRLSK